MAVSKINVFRQRCPDKKNVDCRRYVYFSKSLSRQKCCVIVKMQRKINSQFWAAALTLRINILKNFKTCNKITQSSWLLSKMIFIEMGRTHWKNQIKKILWIFDKDCYIISCQVSAQCMRTKKTSLTSTAHWGRLFIQSRIFEYF